MITIINNAWLPTGVGRYVDAVFSRFLEWGKDVEMIYIDNGKPYGKSHGKIKILKGSYKAEISNYFFLPKKLPGGSQLYHITNETIGRCCSSAKPAVGSCMDLTPFVFGSNYNYLTSFFRKKQLLGLKKAEKIITISENTKKDFLRITKVPGEKVLPIHLGVDKHFFRPIKKQIARKELNLPDDKKIILHVGRDEPRKNVKTVINAFSSLDENSLLLKIGNLSDDNKALAKRLDIVGRIIEMSPEEKFMPFVYSSADAFIFPSYYEGFGLPVLESMACGTPVISSNASSLPEIVGNAGIMHNPDDTQAFAGSVREILENKTISKKLQVRGLENAEKFNWDSCAKKIWAVYESVLRR